LKGRIPNTAGVNLEYTFTSGQCFRWGKFDESGNFEFSTPSEDGYWEGIVYGVPIRLLSHDRYIYYRSPVERVFVPQLGEALRIEEFLKFYLRLDTDLSEIYKQISRDRYIKEAIQKFHGLTILRQEPYETLISYMISPQNSVEKIAQKLNEISLRMGKVVDFVGKRFPIFPTPEDILSKRKEFLDPTLKLRFGINQKKNILKVVEMIKSGSLKIYKLFARPYREVIETLLQIKGVGRKIADCVALFSLEKLEAVPLDVHIKRVTRFLYGDLLGEKPRGINDYDFVGNFWRSYFGKYAGFAQEFLYMYSRAGMIRTKE